MPNNKWERYYPRRIGLTKSKSAASYEILVVGRDEVGALARIANIFAEHKVNLNISIGYEDEEAGKYIQILFCDLAGADCTIEKIESDLRKVKFVNEVRSFNMSDRYHDQFLFPILNSQNKRVLFMRLDSMMKIEKQMIDRMGSAGAVIMFQEGKDYASENVEQMNKYLPPLGTELRLKFGEDSLRASGWGVFKFTKVSEGYAIHIESPPIFPDGTESRFLVGMVAGILEKVCGGSFALEKASYDKHADTLDLLMKRVDTHGTE